ARVAAHLVDEGRLLHGPLDPFGHLLERVLERGTWPGGANDHRAKGKDRVLGASKPQERQGAGEDGCEHQVDDQRRPADGPFGQVWSDHEAAPRRRTFCPGRNACTPAVTTTSPGSMPRATTMRVWSNCAISIARSDTVMLAGSTIHTAGCPSVPVSALAGTA